MVYNLSLEYKTFFKKLVIIFSITLLLTFNLLVVPTQKAHAFAWAGALPASITLAGGAYALGALAVGSLAVGLGLEHGDEIKSSASKVWNSSTQLAKDSLYASMQATVDAGNYVVKAGNNFWDWVSSKASALSATAINAWGSKVTEQAVWGETTVNVGGENVVMQTKFPEAVRDLQTYMLRFNFPKDGPHYFTVSGDKGMGIYKEIYFQVYAGNIYSNVSGAVHTDYVNNMPSGVNLSTEFQRITGKSLTLANLGLTESELNDQYRSIRTIEEFIAFFHSLGLDNINVGTIDTFNEYVSSRQKMLEQDIPRMKDAGMVLPVNEVVPHPVAEPDVTLTYNPDAGTYARPDGTVYTGDVTWTYPNVTVVEVEGVPVVTVPVEGVPTDVWTGNPVDVPVPPGTTNPDAPTVALDLTPLIMTGELFKTKFPFSIAWDVQRQLGIFDVEPETPVIKVDIPEFVKIGNTSMPLKFTIDFSMFDKVALISRWALILAFDIAVILYLRRLIPE